MDTGQKTLAAVLTAAVGLLGVALLLAILVGTTFRVWDEPGGVVVVAGGLAGLIGVALSLPALRRLTRGEPPATLRPDWRRRVAVGAVGMAVGVWSIAGLLLLLEIGFGSRHREDVEVSLRSVAEAQANFRAAHGRFAPDVRTLGVVPRDRVRVVTVAGDSSWSATATHASWPRLSCRIEAVAGPGGAAGPDPVCSVDCPWYGAWLCGAGGGGR